MQKTHQSPSVMVMSGSKVGRKALQPKMINNSSHSPAPITPNSKPDRCQEIQIILPPQIDINININSNSNKENIPPNLNVQVAKKDCFSPDIIESLQDASLADELTAIREKLDRLRVDKEKTEKMLKERVIMLDLKMKEIIHRGDVQKQLEIEVDRLYRLNEIRLSCLRISPIRTLRDKEQEKKVKANIKFKTQETRDYDKHKEESPESKEAEAGTENSDEHQTKY